MPDSNCRDDQEYCPSGSLGSTNGLDSHFSMPDLNFPPDPQLSAAGWERRFMADPERATEATELYRSMGFEVRVEPVQTAELSAWCHGCQILVCRSFKTIYTRKK